MAEILKPSNLSLTWASGGDVLNPGDTKYATGWQVEIPPRQWFNYLDNRQDTALAHINQHGIAVWDSATEYQYSIGGAKSLVMGSNGTIYRALTVNTNQNPTTTVGTHWEIAFANAGDFYTKVQSNANYLAKAQNLADLTNTATARTNLSVYSQAQTYTKTEVDAKTTVASTAQAQAGTSNTTLMTPLRTEEWGNANVLGIGQTWQDVTAVRAVNTTYTNTTGKPIMIHFIGNAGAGGGVFVDGIRIKFDTQDTESITVIIPVGAAYSVVSAITEQWMELR